MKPSSVFVNVRAASRRRAALIDTMRTTASGRPRSTSPPRSLAGRLADVVDALTSSSRRTTRGETRAYEDNVIDILIENLDRLWRDEKADLRNQVL